MTTPKQPATEARRARIAQRLADLMAERGFAVPDRVEQWTAPYEDAAAILEKLWPAIVGEGRERALSDIPGWALNDGITRWFDKEKREQPATEDTEMTTPKQPATEDWRGKWDRIGSRQDRLAYLRTYWPDLMDAIEAEAMTDTPKQPATEAWLDAIRDEVRLAVIDGDADDCSSADCIADAVYEIVRTRLPAIEAWAGSPATSRKNGYPAKPLARLCVPMFRPSSPLSASSPPSRRRGNELEGEAPREGSGRSSSS